MKSRKRLQILGTQKYIAKQCGVTQAAVSKWVKNGIPAKWVIPLERLSGGEISRHELRPDLYPREKDKS